MSFVVFFYIPVHCEIACIASLKGGDRKGEREGGREEGRMETREWRIDGMVAACVWSAS